MGNIRKDRGSNDYTLKPNSSAWLTVGPYSVWFQNWNVHDIRIEFYRKGYEMGSPVVQILLPLKEVR